LLLPSCGNSTPEDVCFHWICSSAQQLHVLLLLLLLWGASWCLTGDLTMPGWFVEASSIQGCQELLLLVLLVLILLCL
jgi:hypothetical protein